MRAANRNDARAPAMSVARPANSGWHHAPTRLAAAFSAASRGAAWPSISADGAAAAGASRDTDVAERGHGLPDAASASACALAKSSHSNAQNGQVQAERA